MGYMYLNSDLHSNKHIKSPILRSISILESSFYIDLSCLLLTEHLLIESTLIDLHVDLDLARLTLHVARNNRELDIEHLLTRSTD